MKLIGLFTGLFFFISAHAQETNIRAQRDRWDFANWKSAYKKRAFCLCLLEGYQNEEMKTQLLKEDKSYYDIIGMAIFDRTLQPLIEEEVQRINREAKERHVSEAAAGKRVAMHCLDFYQGARLDTHVKKVSPEWNKITDIDAEVEKSGIAF